MRRRPLAAAAALAVLGALAGLVVAYAAGGDRRAVVTLAAQVGGSVASPQAKSQAGLLVPTLVDVARSDPVISNVASSAHVSPGAVRHRLHVHAPAGTSLIEVAYDDPSGATAQRLAQQSALVVQSIVAARFGSGPRPVTVAVAEPVRLEAGVRRPLARDVIVGGICGLFLGGILLTGRRRLARPRSDPRAAEDRAAREAEIRERVRAAAPAPEPEPEPEPAPPPAPVDGWEIADLERRTVAAGGPLLAERLAYLSALRLQSRGGVLGHEFDAIVYDVFGDVVD